VCRMCNIRRKAFKGEDHLGNKKNGNGRECGGKGGRGGRTEGNVSWIHRREVGKDNMGGCRRRGRGPLPEHVLLS